MRLLLVLCLLARWLVWAAVGQLATPEPLRQWTVPGGTNFHAAVAGFDGTTAVFRMANGSRAQAPAAKLSTEDQQFLAAWQQKQPIKIVLPEVVGVDAAQVKAEVVSEDPAGEKFVYRTTHFEFESQGKFTQSLLREVARDFEATYELVKALPWNVEPRPASGELFRARLLKDKAAYFAAGGLIGSGGSYKSREELFLVPFESIGVKTVGKSYAKDDKFESHTMVHELTHQMMHFYLDFLPQWVIEGTAEYTGILPLKTGRFRVSAAKSGLKDYVDFLKKRTVDGVPEPYPLDQLFTITNEQWNSVLGQDHQMSHRLYFTSYLLVYYFMHLDGKGDGQLFARYFREVSAVEKDVEKYRKAIDEFKKLPGVETTADGIRWKGDLKPPARPAILSTPDARKEFAAKTLDILRDGRSDAELMKQIRSAYTRLGVRL
ncbi:MAG: hypothetical protein WCF18_19155 [Chthoniobacteraceae bacterium]